MWTYSQTTGDLTNPSGLILGQGYSGNGIGLNNSALQNDPDVGPCPQGDWQIGQFFDDIGGKGPLVTHLTPMEGTATFGRSGLMIHGDNSEANHTASEGCVILSRPLREAIASSGDNVFMVNP